MQKAVFFGIKAGPVLLIIALLYSCSSPPQNYIILCAGDSITEMGYPPFLEQILKEEGIRAKVLNQGKSGHTSREYLAFLEKNKKKLAQNFPDFICLQLGTNDVRIDHDHTPANEFYANMKKIISLFRDFRTRSGKSSHILLATIPPIPNSTPFPFDPSSVDRVQQEINPLIQRIAAEENCILVDNTTVFSRSPHLLIDVHPSDKGYAAMALNWHNALKKEGLQPTGKT